MSKHGFVKGNGHARPEAPGNTDTVLVASVFGGTVTVPFYRSINHLRNREAQLPPGDRRLAQTLDCSGLYVAENRQAVSSRFFNDEALQHIPWLLWIDSDISFPPTLLHTVLELAATVRARVMAVNVPLGSHPSVAYNRTERVGLHANIYPLPSAQVFECDAVATAVCLIHREVFESIAREMGQCWFNHMYVPYIPDGRLETRRETRFRGIGEDMAFCERAQKAGHRIWCAQRVPGVIHWKTRPLSDIGGQEEPMATHAALLKDEDVGEVVREVSLAREGAG